MMYLELEKGKVDIYYTFIPEEKFDINELIDLLFCKEEISMVKGFGSDKRRLAYVISRCIIKDHLSCITGENLKNIAFIKGKYGKLFLEPIKHNNKATGIQFNISHCDGMVAYVATINSNVGIDVEFVRRDIFKVVNTFFYNEEIEFIKSFSDMDKNKECHRMWTLKEAFVKAKGMGLLMPFDSFNVLETKDVEFFNIEVKENYYLSVAVEKTDDLNDVNFRVFELDLLDMIKKIKNNNL